MSVQVKQFNFSTTKIANELLRSMKYTKGRTDKLKQEQKNTNESVHTRRDFHVIGIDGG